MSAEGSPAGPGRPDAAARRLRLATGALAVAGLAISAYLTWVHYSGKAPVCVGGGQSCETVQASRYAELLGVPVAIYGVAGYALLLATALVRGELAAAASLLVAVAGVGFSAYLTYLELAVIDAICQWCVASAVVMVLALGVAVARIARDPGPLSATACLAAGFPAGAG